MHFHVLGSLHHVHNKNSGLPLYVLQALCMTVSDSFFLGSCPSDFRVKLTNVIVVNLLQSWFSILILYLLCEESRETLQEI
jgi:hypothetical protein